MKIIHSHRCLWLAFFISIVVILTACPKVVYKPAEPVPIYLHDPNPPPDLIRYKVACDGRTRNNAA